jgi:hypothetical protein
MKVIPGVPDEKRQIQSTKSPDMCLEASHSGLAAVKCAAKPNSKQMLSAAQLPSLLQQEYSVTPGLVNGLVKSNDAVANVRIDCLNTDVKITASNGFALESFGGYGVYEGPNSFTLPDGAVTKTDTNEQAWVLVMKLSKADFCYGSPRWTDGRSFNADKMKDDTLPNHKEYDAKSAAFHTLSADGIKLQTNRVSFEDAPVVEFRGVGTPEQLMTGEEIKLVKHPDWDTWKAAFGSDRDRAPTFVRAGKMVSDPAPICRTLGSTEIQGCGKPCMFCMMANDGTGCPAAASGSDVNIGIGNNAAFCGGGDGSSCSASSKWSGNLRVLVWARLSNRKPETSAPQVHVDTWTVADAGEGLVYMKTPDNLYLEDSNGELVGNTGPTPNQKWTISDGCHGSLGNEVKSRSPSDTATDIQFVDTSKCFAENGRMITLKMFVARVVAMKIQIYRQVDISTYKLVRESKPITPRTAQAEHIHIFDEPFDFEAGDCIGWSHAGQGVIKFSNGGNAIRYRSGIEAVGSDIDMTKSAERTYSYSVTYTTCEDEAGDPKVFFTSIQNRRLEHRYVSVGGGTASSLALSAETMDGLPPGSNRAPPPGYVAKEGAVHCRCIGSGIGLDSCGELCCAASPYTDPDPKGKYPANNRNALCYRLQNNSEDNGGGGQGYAFGAADSEYCPSGYTTMTDSAQCKAAAKGITWGGHTARNVNVPNGCYASTNKKAIGFNTNPNGAWPSSLSGGWFPVCTVVTPQACDWQCYLDRYADLKAAFGSNLAAAENHYNSHGAVEGRLCTCEDSAAVGGPAYSGTLHVATMDRAYADSKTGADFSFKLSSGWTTPQTLATSFARGGSTSASVALAEVPTQVKLIARGSDGWGFWKVWFVSADGATTTFAENPYGKHGNAPPEYWLDGDNTLASGSSEAVLTIPAYCDPACADGEECTSNGCKAPAYTFGTANSEDCPGGYTIITDSATCQGAYPSKTWGGHTATNSKVPNGCYASSSESAIGFNTNPSGGGSSSLSGGWLPVCKLAGSFDAEAKEAIRRRQEKANNQRWSIAKASSETCRTMSFHVDGWYTTRGNCMPTVIGTGYPNLVAATRQCIADDPCKGVYLAANGDYQTRRGVLVNDEPTDTPCNVAQGGVTYFKPAGPAPKPPGWVSMQGFLMEQNCGENAIDAIGWFEDELNNASLAMFATCAQASMIGAPLKKNASLGGEMDVEWTTCSAANAGTNSHIVYQLNQLPPVVVGKPGRLPGDADSFIISYDEPFETFKIFTNTTDGWQICRLKVAGMDLPTENMALNLPEFPCWIDQTFDNPGSCEFMQVTITGNRMPQELARARIECPTGTAITKLRKERKHIFYECGMIAGLGACVPGQTEQLDTSSGKFDALKYAKVACPSGTVLQSILPEESTGGRWLRFRFTCCQNGGVPISVLPTGNLLDNSFQDIEGTYCPTGRDDAGRLMFKREVAYKASDASAARYLQHNKLKGTWCIGGSCLKSKAAHPLDAGFAGSAWETVPVSDFNGKFEGKGVVAPPAPPVIGGGGGGGTGAPKRKPPKVVEFGAAEVQYKEECKDESTPGTSDFSLDTMNDVAMGLPDGNPCKLIGGKWENNEGDGPATWITHGYDNTDNTQEAGTTYDSVFGCDDREGQRDIKAAQWAKTHDEFAMASDLLQPALAFGCSLMPDTEISPMGMGITIAVGDLCSTVVDGVTALTTYENDKVLLDNDYKMTLDNDDDCGTLQMGLGRVFCDLHCIRDAVKAGDKAILTSVEQAAGAINENTKLMVEFYSDGLQDSLNTIMNSMKGGSLLQQAREMDTRLHGMFTELKGMSGGLRGGGRTTTLRALENFNALFQTPNLGGGNASVLFETIASESAKLEATLRTTVDGKLSTAAQAAHRTTKAVEHMQRTIAVRVHMLGIYNTKARSAKLRQQQMVRAKDASVSDLVDELHQSSAVSILLKLDQIWWTLRQSLDAYMEVATTQAQAYDGAFSLLEAYTSNCAAGFSDLKSAYNHAVRADTDAHEQLRRTWSTVKRELGLLAATIEDGDAFIQLGRLDAASIDADSLGENRSTVCKGETGSEAAVRTAVEAATKGGLATQTWVQIQSIFMEVPMMRDRFLSAGMRAPGLETAVQAWSRVVSSYKIFLAGRSELTAEVAERIQRRAC